MIHLPGEHGGSLRAARRFSWKAAASVIDKREILEAASSCSLLPSVVEKDDVLGRILAGINAQKRWRNS
jgi:hypothetical protein